MKHKSAHLLIKLLLNPRNYQVLLLLSIISFDSAKIFAQPPGGGPPPDRIFDYMDRNRDGRLTEEEVERMPGNSKDYFRENRIDLERGISKEKFIEIAPKMFEVMRERREEEERKRAEEKNKENSNSSTSNSSSKKDVPKNSAVWVPPKRDRVTMELSKNYITLDADRDDQVGLYEWRSANKGTTTDFDLIDLDHDGFLTPKEISYFEAKPKSTSNATTSKPASSPAPGNSTTPDTTQPDKSLMPKEVTKLEKKAEKLEAKENKESKESKENSDEKLDSEAAYLVGILDKNKNGIINPDEWSVSKKLKPAFEQAGINISQDMSKEDFITNYRKVGSGWRK